QPEPAYQRQTYQPQAYQPQAYRHEAYQEPAQQFDARHGMPRQGGGAGSYRAAGAVDDADERMAQAFIDDQRQDSRAGAVGY
uniref:hypothetical protein n=1 Tax=Klebsiella pneumoniae TaxID=573 RepID=UPI0019535A22